MRNQENYPQDLLRGLPAGFAGQLVLLRYDYTLRASEVSLALEPLADSAPRHAKAVQWREALAENTGAFLAGVEFCLETTAQMEAETAAGRLALDKDRVVAEIIRAESAIMGELTELQRISADSLRQVFDLGLTSQIRDMEAGEGACLRRAIGLQADGTQFISNALQDLAIFLKERNKVITHPLDENHPE
jgi:hypothetical protein